MSMELWDSQRKKEKISLHLKQNRSNDLAKIATDEDIKMIS